MNAADPVATAAGDDEREPLRLIRDALRGLRFGEIVVTVHDGEVVQVVRSEKVRVAPSRGSR